MGGSALRPAAAFLFIASAAAAQESSTAILVQPVGDALVVTGDDGKAHVEYDLLVTNAFPGPITLDTVEVTGPDGAVLGTLSGAALEAATLGIVGGAPIRPLPANGSAGVEIDLVLEPGQVPAHLGHRVSYKAAPDDPYASMVATWVVSGPEVAVSARQPVTILSPLAGSGWASLNGCCTPNIHRTLRIAEGTRLTKPELFAVDWIRLGEDGRFFTGEGKINQDFPYFGAEIRAVADGEVVGARDGMPEDLPFEKPTTVEAPGDYGGNYLLIRMDPETYALYAHLQPGSLDVKVGDRVTRGQPIGRLGNTGNSTAPHLHFGLIDRPDFLTGTSLPFVIENFEVTGAVTGGEPPALQITPGSRKVPAGYPLVGNIATFR